MRAVIYGAGNIGRGFIAQLFSTSGYEITFIDVNEALVDLINCEQKYPLRLLAPEKTRELDITNVKAVNGNRAEEAAGAIAAADIMATAVGVRVLPFIAPIIAAGLKKRFAAKNNPLNIIICENLIDANKVLEKLIKKNLDDKEKNIFDSVIGLVEASIGRMVPIQTDEMRDKNPLRICAEEYDYLPVDKNTFKGTIPQIKGMLAFDNFDFYIERKLFIHNMGHAICAYLGMRLDYEYIWQAVNNGEILFIAQNAMLESARALSIKHKVPLAELQSHILDLLRRFSNRALGDTCQRVGADTTRKLGQNDRLVGAIRRCEDAGVAPFFVSAGTAAAVFHHLKTQNLEPNKSNAVKVLAEISDITEKLQTGEIIVALFACLAEQNALQKIIRHIFLNCGANTI